MRNILLATIGLSAAMAIGATAVNAATADLGTCTKARSQVENALASNNGSSNHDAAVKESNYGRDFCANGRYQIGMQHYAQALKLLGVS